MSEIPDTSATVQNQSDTSVPAEKQPFRKQFPWLILPAVITLVIMGLIFVLAVCSSMTRYNIVDGLYNSPYVGTRNYQMNSQIFSSGAWNTLVAKLLVLGVSGALSALICVLYSFMKKPKTILTAACLWLIPAAVPTVIMAAATFSFIARRWLYSAAFLTASMGLQTLGIFCFAGGLFAWAGLRKNGRVGKAPFMGLLAAVLVYLMASLSTSGVYFGAMPMNYTPLLDKSIFVSTSRGYSQTSALSVCKILLQLAIGLIPLFFLVRISTKEFSRSLRATRAELWLFPAALAGILLALFIRVPAKSDNGPLDNQILTTAIITLSGAAIGGLVIWSFIHLFRRSSAWLYSILLLVLSAAMSCSFAPLRLIVRTGIHYTMLPCALYAAVDWRLIMLAGILAFVLRSDPGIHPGKLILSIVLLSGAFAWGSVTNNVIYIAPRCYPLSVEFFRMFAKPAETPAETLQLARLLVLLPPLALSSAAAFFMRKAFVTD